MSIRIARFVIVGLLGLLVSACASFQPAVTYDVSTYGALPDGKTVDTVPLQNALNACAAAGGGQVLIPSGRYVIGSVQMYSNTVIRLDPGAVLVGSPDVNDYPLMPVRFEGETVNGHRALIYAENADHIGIVGGGTLAGDQSLGNLRNPRGPCMVEFVGCRDIHLTDFTDTYRRMWSIHLLNCQNADISHLRIRTTRPNSDGIDVDSTQHVRITDCDIDSGDDCVAIKSGRGLEAVQSYQPTTDVVISNCTMGSGFSAVGIGTEMSAGVSDIHIEHCTFTHGDCGIFIKARTGRGGYFRDISADDITATNLVRFLGIDLVTKGITGTEPVRGDAGIPEANNISVTNVKVSKCGILVDGTHVSPKKLLDGLTLSNWTGESGRGIRLANMTNVTLDNIQVSVAREPKLAIRNVTGTGLADAAIAQPDIADMQGDFEVPPDNTKIQVRWWWFGPAVTDSELEREMLAMKAGGIGGFEVQPTYPLALDGEIPGLVNLKFLSPEFLDRLRFVAQKAKELGLRMDLTLGSGWPYGGRFFTIDDAAGRLRVANADIPAGSSQAPIPELRNGESLIAAFHTADNQATYFIASHTGMKVKRPAYGAEGYVIDHLSAAATQEFIQDIAKLEVDACGANPPYSIFCDSLEVMGEDWTTDFLSEFKQLRGYDLKPLLPALVGDAGPKTLDIRRDWGLTLTQLFNRNFVQPLERFAQLHDTRFRIQAYGSPSAAQFTYSQVDLPEGEGWEWHRFRETRYAASATHLMGIPVASSESFTWIHSPSFRATPLDVKANADLYFLQGINQIVCHGWPYTAAGVPDPGWSFYAAGVFDEKNPWYIVMPDLALYMQRVSFMMRQGSPDNDVLLYLPNNDVWAHFTLGNISLTNGLGRWLGPNIVGAILDSGHNLDFFDDEMLALRGKVTGDTISFGDLHYKVVVLAGVERIPPETMQKLEEFARGGGIVIATRRLPAVAPGYLATDQDQKLISDIAYRLFQAPNAPGIFVQDESQLPQALNQRLSPDVSLSPAAPEVGFVHRHANEGEIYFLANTSNHPVHATATFRDQSGYPEWWNPVTGNVTPARSIGDSTVPLNLAPYESTILIWTQRKPARYPAPGGSPVNLDMSDGWSVCFGDSTDFVPLESLHSWTDDPATRFFSGVATYKKIIDLPDTMVNDSGRMSLDFGQGTPAAEEGGGRAGPGYHTSLDAPIRDAAVVYVNGHRAGSLWCPPYVLDITGLLKQGENDIRVNVANTAINELAGSGFPNYDYRGVTEKYGNRFQPQDVNQIRPIPSGIIGKIQLIAIPR